MSDFPKDPSQKAVDNVSVGGDANINVTQTINQLSSLTPEEKQKSGSLEMLLTRLDEDWLDRFKDGEKLSSEKAIKLVLETRYEFSNKTRKNDVDKNIEDIFTEWKHGNRLLILGDPGAGKTTALLQLAKKFREQINKENILDKPIPVMFHLSSWESGKSIDEWLIQELDKYGFRAKSTKDWVDNQSLFLLMDGLDQVNPAHQAECIKEINKFGASNIVVCSRFDEYNNLFKSADVVLKMDLSVYVKSLEDEQINQYLETLNKLSLKTVLDKDETLNKLAKIPFWLNIMIDVDKSLPNEGSSKERQNKLFEAYIEKRFNENENKKRDGLKDDKKKTIKWLEKTIKWLENKKRDGSKYDKKETIKWLTWLADRLVVESKSIFLIEQMQPSWLITKDQKTQYLRVLLSIGMLLGLLFGIPYGVIFYFYLSYSWELPLNFPGKGIFFGVAAGSIIGTAAQYFLKLNKIPIRTHKEVFLSWQKMQETSWEFLKKGVKDATRIWVLVFLFCIFFVPFLQFFPEHSNMNLLTSVIIASFFGIVTMIFRLLSNSFIEKDDIKTVKPNQGILDSFQKAYLIGKIAIVVVAIINTLLILILHGMPNSVHHLELIKLFFTLIIGLCSALVTGGVAAFIHDSGRVCQQHFALRIVVWTNGYIPLNYEDFLDYTSDPKNELSFLNKIGGGYYFFNRIFKEYLAERKE
jgi:MFS family permease